MSDETKALIVGPCVRRVVIDLDRLRESDGEGEIGPSAVTMAVARALLAEIDRLSASVKELEGRVADLEGWGNL